MKSGLHLPAGGPAGGAHEAAPGRRAHPAAADAGTDGRSASGSGGAGTPRESRAGGAGCHRGGDRLSVPRCRADGRRQSADRHGDCRGAAGGPHAAGGGHRAQLFAADLSA
ncbi:hypothetical protein AAY84_10385 [Serratia marcescens]|nr:hypothetical protein AAY84_10385 [Serratia marcescens]